MTRSGVNGYAANRPGREPATLEVEIWRGAERGRFERYRVPRWSNQTVLDVVSHVQRHLEPSLAYRYACRVGVCGSCTMTVNGTARWTCRTHVTSVDGGRAIRIEPLRNFPVVKDLVCDVSEFFDKLAQAGGRFEPTRTRNEDFATVPPDSRERRIIDSAIECIGCGACYASCAVEAMDPAYLGPAALNRVWTLYNDVRDAAREQRLAKVLGDGGCHSCKTLMSCNDLCPKGIPLTASIAGLKRASAGSLLTGGRSGKRRKHGPGPGVSAAESETGEEEHASG